MSRSIARPALAAGAIVLMLLGACSVSVAGSGRYDAGGAASTAPDGSTLDGSAPTPPGGPAPVDLEGFYRQTLTWADCGGDYRCATLLAPIDYDHPDAGVVELAVKATSAAAPALGSLVVNPGGPGASAVDFVESVDLALRMSGAAAAEVRSGYRLIGIDPRGVGHSTPVTCLAVGDLDVLLGADPSPDTPQELAEAQQLIIGQGQACAANTGLLASHVTTVEAAKDLDLLRAALGEDRLNLLGFSYGTFLGATYASLFPANVGRMVLDGAVDPAESTSQAIFGQATGFQTAFDAWAADCVARGTGCGIGSTVDQAGDAVRALLQRLDSDPLPTDDPDRPLTEAHGMFGVIGALYDRSLWSSLGAALRAAIRDGDGSRLLRLSDAYTERKPAGGYASNMMQAFTAISCLDARSNPNTAVVGIEQYRASAPTFADQFYSAGLDCAALWPLAPTTTWPDYRAAGAAPILVVGTTRDPATPYRNSVALAEQLSSGVLLSRDGDGHTAYLGASRCINDTVSRYLAQGTVPADGTDCGTS